MWTLCSCAQENRREWIEHIMTQHEVTIKQLADTSLGGHIFLGLIQRWEMNNEPPPPEEAKVERLASLFFLQDRCSPSAH
jgi:hypothetical protein